MIPICNSGITVLKTPSRGLFYCVRHMRMCLLSGQLYTTGTFARTVQGTGFEGAEISTPPKGRVTEISYENK